MSLKRQRSDVPYLDDMSVGYDGCVSTIHSEARVVENAPLATYTPGSPKRICSSPVGQTGVSINVVATATARCDEDVRRMRGMLQLLSIDGGNDGQGKQNESATLDRAVVGRGNGDGEDDESESEDEEEEEDDEEEEEDDDEEEEEEDEDGSEEGGAPLPDSDPIDVSSVSWWAVKRCQRR